jgi:pimeloyl-ACP methyl ester carboxylesterase
MRLDSMRLASRSIALALAAAAFAALASAASAPAAPAAAPALTLSPVKVELRDGPGLAVEEGMLTVPANRSRPDGRTMRLHVVRIAGKPGTSRTPTLYLAGGPGEDATGMLRLRSGGRFVDAFRSLGDLVLLDQRGTGRSEPVPTCAPSAPLPADALFVDGAAMARRTHDAVAQCVAEWSAKGVAVADFNSRDAADDLEDLRRALGVSKLNLVAFSYGTHLALEVMRRHPEALERVVLLGTEGPADTYKLPSTLDLQLRKLSALAAADPRIRAEVPDMMALLRQVLAQLDAAPVTVTVHDRAADRDVGVRVGRWGLLRILRWDVGDGHDFIVFPALLHGIANGDTRLLARYVEKRWNGLGRGVALMPLATDCADGAGARRLEQIRAESPSSVFGELTNYPFPDVCAALGDVDLGDEGRGPIVASVPTLFVSGTLDSNTPPYQAETVRWGLTDATHLIVDNAGHEDTQPMPEVQKAIFDFLAGKDVSGRRLALPPPHFLTIEEARGFEP